MKILSSLQDPELIALLKNGAVGVIPTDTVYGIVCKAADESSVARLYETKHRENKPGTLIAANIKQFADLGIDEHYLKAIEHFWPNAVSVRIPYSPVNYLVDIPTGTVAVRIPNDSALLQLMEQTGALQTSSANIAGEPVATTLAEAQDYFRDTIDFYVDGGDLSNRAASTIVQIIDNKIVVVRQGAATIDTNITF
jgi:tRNA threonylcarbamoyl adenosine modification protein (Sua5/YciO/YrdC/YwlC family)